MRPSHQVKAKQLQYSKEEPLLSRQAEFERLRGSEKERNVCSSVCSVNYCGHADCYWRQREPRLKDKGSRKDNRCLLTTLLHYAGTGRTIEPMGSGPIEAWEKHSMAVTAQHSEGAIPTASWLRVILNQLKAIVKDVFKT